MKIIYKVGDLLTTPNRFLVQGCNAQGAMGSGVAKLIRAVYPKVYELYRQEYLDSGLYLGQVVSVAVPSVMYNGHTYPERIILNAITQEYAGHEDVRYVSYDGIAKAIEQINGIVRLVTTEPVDGELPEVSFPLIGAGLARGDWYVIARLIETLSTKFQPVVYVQTQADMDNIISLLAK